MFSFGHALPAVRGPVLALIVLAIQTVASAEDVAPLERAPLPATDAQDRVTKLIRDVFKKEYDGAKTPARKVALARKLLEQADESSDATECFVLLRVARDMAALSGDPRTASVAIGRLAQRYRVDADTMTREMLAKSLGHATAPAQYRAIAELAADAIDGALFSEKHDLAVGLAETAVAAAGKAGDAGLVERMTARSAEIGQAMAAHKRIEDARAVLEKDPTDQSANLTVGRYCCFFRGDWERGLPMLALAGDGQFSALARKELIGATTTVAQVALGDGWWELIDKHQGIARRQIRARAAHWYEQASAGLSGGLTALRVKKRLEEVASAEAADFEPGDVHETAGKDPTASTVRKKRSFAGTWRDRFGNVIEFRVSPNRQVVGTYQKVDRSEYVERRGRIVGKFSRDGRTLNGQWARSPSYKSPEAGPLVFKLSRDGNSFTGQYRSGNSTTWNTWAGVRIQPTTKKPEGGDEPELPPRGDEKPAMPEKPRPE